MKFSTVAFLVCLIGLFLVGFSAPRKEPHAGSVVVENSTMSSADYRAFSRSLDRLKGKWIIEDFALWTRATVVVDGVPIVMIGAFGQWGLNDATYERTHKK